MRGILTPTTAPTIDGAAVGASLWTRLDDAGKQRLTAAAGLRTADTEDLVQMAELAFQSSHEEPEVERPHAEIRAAFIKLTAGLKAYENVRRRKSMYPYRATLEKIFPHSWFVHKRFILNAIDELEWLAEPNKRGRPLRAGRKIGELTESLLVGWIEISGKPLGRGKGVGTVIGFYSTLLPMINVIGNAREWHEPWDEGDPREPNETLADLCLAAMPAAIKRINRRPSYHNP